LLMLFMYEVSCAFPLGNHKLYCLLEQLERFGVLSFFNHSRQQKTGKPAVSERLASR
jgi:hypothetical protein